MRLWVDVEDLIEYALHTKRPSGIQRVSYELQCALVEIAPDSIEFVRHCRQSGGFITVPFADIEALFDGLSADLPVGEEASAAEEIPAAARPLSRYRRWRRRAAAMFPHALYQPGIRLWVSAAAAVAAAIAFIKTMFSLRTWRKPQKSPLPKSLTIPILQQQPVSVLQELNGPISQELNVVDHQPHDQTRVVAGDDWFIVLGSPWCFPAYAARVSDFCALHNLRFAILIYDIIPLRRPEWVDYGLQLAFRDWFRTVLPLADAVLAISNASAQDMEWYAKEASLALPGRVGVIPLGTEGGNPAVAARTRRLPPRRSFALIVSTIEIRKNHLLLFRIWRELTETMNLDEVPTLVFAGRLGWLVQDLMQQLKNTSWLNGKIMLIEDPSDPELETLYEDCMFTLYPSFYEGWGLPVTESLAHGAPCISSNRTSLPEAGGDLSVYFDPDQLAEATRIVREVIENPAALQAWRERVKNEFKPIPWTDSARAIIEHLQNARGPGIVEFIPATVAAAD